MAPALQRIRVNVDALGSPKTIWVRTGSDTFGRLLEHVLAAAGAPASAAAAELWLGDALLPCSETVEMLEAGDVLTLRLLAASSPPPAVLAAPEAAAAAAAPPAGAGAAKYVKPQQLLRGHSVANALFARGPAVRRLPRLDLPGGALGGSGEGGEGEEAAAPPPAAVRALQAPPDVGRALVSPPSSPKGPAPTQLHVPHSPVQPFIPSSPEFPPAGAPAAVAQRKTRRGCRAGRKQQAVRLKRVEGGAPSAEEGGSAQGAGAAHAVSRSTVAAKRWRAEEGEEEEEEEEGGVGGEGGEGPTTFNPSDFGFREFGRQEGGEHYEVFHSQAAAAPSDAGGSGGGAPSGGAEGAPAEGAPTAKRPRLSAAVMGVSRALQMLGGGAGQPPPSAPALG